MKPFACGKCGYLALEISDLHDHLLDHNDIVGYFLHISYRTAFPRPQYTDSQTQTEDEVIKDTELDNDLSEIKSEVSTNENAELQANCTNIDYLKESQMPPKEELADADLEFREDTFEGTDNPGPLDSMENNFLVPMDKSDQSSLYEYTGLTSNTNHFSQNTFYMLRSTASSDHDYAKNGTSNSQFKQLSTAEAKYIRKQSNLTKKITSSDSVEDPDVGASSDVTEDCSETVNDNPTGIHKTVYDDIPQYQIIHTALKGLNRIEQFEYFYNVYLGDNNDYVLKCTICSFWCLSKRDMKAHISAHSNETSIICEVCGKSLANKEAWKVHCKRCHRKYKCRICSAKFAQSIEQIKHEQSHNSVWPLVCDQCGKAYRTQRTLNRHLQCVHSDVRSYKCNQCAKSFKISSGLTKHLRIHNNILAHSCQFCEKKFSTRWNMKAHMRKHTGDKPYSCVNCGESFSHNVVRKTHQAKCRVVPGDKS